MCAYLIPTPLLNVTFVSHPVVFTVTSFNCVAAVSCAGAWVQVGKKCNRTMCLLTF